MAETLVELVRIIGGQAPLWPLHRWRLMNSALMVGVPLPELVEPRGGVDRAIRLELSDGVVRMTDEALGTNESIALATSPAPHRGYPHKISARAWLDAACMTGQATGADDALLFDVEGRLIEASRWAIGWWDGEQLCFPPLGLGGLPSVARARLTEMVRGGLHESVVTRDQLARRSFVACNATAGLVSVGMLDGAPIGDNGRTAGLAKRFWDRTDA
jgi:branched-subunit amino acid aminotransferase/4-amino-4-deoxychorismate lyase